MKMETIVTLIEPDEIHHYIRNHILQSDIFKKNYDERGIVYQLVDQLAQYPCAFFDSSDLDVETPHFSTWWRFFQNRQYPSPEMHDLYRFHEWWHAAKMVYQPGQSHPNFSRKMVDNELDASTGSEMNIYHEIPELRALTLPHPIYVDRFLFPDGYENAPDAARLARWQNPYERELMMQEMALARRDILMRQALGEEDFDDPVEFWLWKFAHQNEIWVNTWKMKYNQVETAMAQFQERCRAGDKAGAMHDLKAWLTSDAVTMGTGIPFPAEAAAFYAAYRGNIDAYKRTFERTEKARPMSQIRPDDPSSQFRQVAGKRKFSWMVDQNDPAVAEIIRRAQALGIKADPDKAAHALGEVNLASGKAVKAHVVHAIDPIITDGEAIFVTLINRMEDPGRGKAALNGGFLDPAKGGAVETGVKAAVRESLEEVGLQLGRGILIGERNMDRPFDVRICRGDGLREKYGIEDGDVFLVSTQPVVFIVPDLKDKKLEAGDDAVPGSARIVEIESLTEEMMAVPDHLPMIYDAVDYVREEYEAEPGQPSPDDGFKHLRQG